MPHRISREVFTEEHLEAEDVQGFDCGDEVWEREVSDWLKRPLGEDGALTSVRNEERPGRVWLYRSESDGLVGFGALGYSEWRWTKKKDPFVPLTAITWCAVQKRLWGAPAGPKEDRYSHTILKNLITEALDDAETHPLLGLMVHPANLKAIKFYRDFGFNYELEPRKDRETGVLYNRMAQALDGEALGRVLTAAKKK